MLGTQIGSGLGLGLGLGSELRSGIGYVVTCTVAE